MTKPIKLICGIDLEGMSEDLPNKGVNLLIDRITEIGAVLWDVEMNQPVKIYSELISEEDRIPISEEITELTGITEEMLETYGLKGEAITAALERLSEILNQADYIMAHNGEGYDRPMLGALFNRFGVPLPGVNWIDSCKDIEFPRKIKGRSLALLEHSHGFINPFPHRAITDVLSMLKIATKYDIPRMAALADSPEITLVAKLNAPNWKNKEDVQKFNTIKNKVSKARFRWNPDNKTWVKKVPKLLLDEGLLDFDFDFESYED
jgi:DNA polymerase-3 subunit epsilon